MLSDRANEILDLEERFPAHTGLKSDAILNMSRRLTFYYQELNRIIDDPEAMRERPMLVKRLQRGRARRIQARESRSFG